MSRIKFLLIGALLITASACYSEGEATEAPAPAPAPDCGYEDMLPYALTAPAYGLPAGHVICIHVDQAMDAPAP